MPGRRILTLVEGRPDPGVLREAGDLLRRGGLVAHPTETLYGLAVDPWNPDALGRLLRLKGRPAEAGMILLVSSLQEALALVTGPEPETALRLLAGAFWPGPLSIVAPASDRVPSAVRGPTDGVAVRLSSDPVAGPLPGLVGSPVTSSSANRSGEAPCSSAEQVEELLGDEVDMILDGGPRAAGEPSTVVDLTSTPFRVLREGAIPSIEIEKALAGS
jgi:L-threonylcarbamoyladenylate synthase